MAEKREISNDELSTSVVCRDLRHAWDPAGDVVLIEQNGQVRHFARRLCCLRCGTYRTDEYKISSFALQRVRSKYDYPNGYTIRGGIPIAEVRFRVFKNAQMVPKEVSDAGQRED